MAKKGKRKAAAGDVATNRQAAVKELSRLVDLILVIGAPNSSNCNRLREVAEANGVTAYLLNGPEELKSEWLKGVEEQLKSMRTTLLPAHKLQSMAPEFKVREQHMA